MAQINTFCNLCESGKFYRQKFSLFIVKLPVPQTPYRGFAPGPHCGTSVPQTPLSVRYFRLWHLATLPAVRSAVGIIDTARRTNSIGQILTLSSRQENTVSQKRSWFSFHLNTIC